MSKEEADLKFENENLKSEIKLLNEDITWWTDRFNAVERDNRNLKEEIARLKDKLKEIKNNRNDITKDEVYLNMRKETLVKTINLKRDTISYLASERRKLQQRIDKAREFIYRYWITYDESKNFTEFNEEMNILIKDIKELLEILGDKDVSSKNKN